MRHIFIALITVYQKAISPFLPSSCRFYPSCSQYSKEAFEKYGTLRGGFKSAKRVLRCNPFHEGGYDPLD